MAEKECVNENKISNFLLRKCNVPCDLNFQKSVLTENYKFSWYV